MHEDGVSEIEPIAGGNDRRYSRLAHAVLQHIDYTPVSHCSGAPFQHPSRVMSQGCAAIRSNSGAPRALTAGAHSHWYTPLVHPRLTCRFFFSQWGFPPSRKVRFPVRTVLSDALNQEQPRVP